MQLEGLVQISLVYSKKGGDTVAKVNRQHSNAAPDGCQAPVPYASSGHPSIEELLAQQGTGPIADVALLYGDSWPEEETIEKFLATLREWRGQTN